MAMLPQDGAESLKHHFFPRPGTIGQRYKDEITLVALNILEVLDKDWLASFPNLGPVALHRLIAGYQESQLLVYQLRLIGVHGNQTNRRRLVEASMLSHESHGLLRDTLGFRRIASCFIDALNPDSVD